MSNYNSYNNYNNSNNNNQQYSNNQQNNDHYYNDYGFPIQLTPMQSLPQQLVIINKGQTSGFAVTSLVVGILGLLGLHICGAFLIGILCGHLALIKINASNGAITGRGMAIAGLILNYLPIVIMLVMLIFSLLFRRMLTG